VFSEGGPRVASSLIAQGLADEVMLFTSPKPFGREGVPALAQAARAQLEDAARFHRQHDGWIGNDHFEIFERV